MDDLVIDRGLTIPAAELQEGFSRSGGPGGQNVNKVATQVELRWNVTDSPVLTARQRDWLIRRLGSRLTNEGDLIVTSSATREQVRNRDDARDKLATIVRRALARPKQRKKTQPTRASVERRLERKRQRARKKRLRRSPTPEE